nr:MAG TPA: hypothetical protein [Caudoviricetes sp.]
MVDRDSDINHRSVSNYNFKIFLKKKSPHSPSPKIECEEHSIRKAIQKGLFLIPILTINEVKINDQKI